MNYLLGTSLLVASVACMIGSLATVFETNNLILSVLGLWLGAIGLYASTWLLVCAYHEQNA